MGTDYEVIEEIEVLREFSAGILADIDRYIKDFNINKEGQNNIIFLIKEEVIVIFNGVYDIKTMKDAFITRGKLQIINQVVNNPSPL